MSDSKQKKTQVIEKRGLAVANDANEWNNSVLLGS